MAVRAFQAYEFGVHETLDSLVEKSPVILASTVLIGGIGYLIGGTLASIVAAKIAFCCLSAFYGLGHPEFIQGINPATDRTFRLMGNLTPILVFPLIAYWL